MKVKVRMLAFHDYAKIREVDVPKEEWTEADEQKRLSLVFYYGQNDFQPRPVCSASVGDVIDMDGKHWLVKALGFYELTPEKLREWETMGRRARRLHDLTWKS